MFKLVTKVKTIKNNIKVWNCTRRKEGEKVSNIQRDAAEVQKLLDTDPANDYLNKLYVTFISN